jgi:hypothetical protein
MVTYQEKLETLDDLNRALQALRSSIELYQIALHAEGNRTYQRLAADDRLKRQWDEGVRQRDIMVQHLERLFQ